MVVTRHISLDYEHIEKMKPYLVKHNGNFCYALREIINLAGKYSSRTNSMAIDISLFAWMLKEIEDILIPDKVLDEIINPGMISSMSKLEEYVKQRLGELEWDIDLVMKYDSDAYPSGVVLELGGSSQKIKFVACMLSQYLVKNSLEYAPLSIKYAVSINDMTRVELCRSNKKEAQSSLFTHFGRMDEVIRAVRGSPSFWRDVIRRHVSSNYNMVTVHRNYLEDLFANNIPAGEMMFEALSKKPVHEIPLGEMLSLIKEVYEASRIVERVEIDKDTLIISHTYRTRAAAEKLKHSLVFLLESSGHLYEAKSTTNLIVMRHRPDVGVKINEMVNKLKTSSSTVDQELLMFMAFLEGLKDMPDIPMFLAALGRRIGRSLMQEYEKENNIRHWNPETFRKAMEIIDSRLHRVSEWKLDGRNLLYTVRKCHIASGGNTFDIYICQTVREAFKGALNYAFGNKAEINIKKLVTHGDNFCEVIIRIP